MLCLVTGSFHLFVCRLLPLYYFFIVCSSSFVHAFRKSLVTLFILLHVFIIAIFTIDNCYIDNQLTSERLFNCQL